jgi:hypothetical protein
MIMGVGSGQRGEGVIRHPPTPRQGGLARFFPGMVGGLLYTPLQNQKNNKNAEGGN